MKQLTQKETNDILEFFKNQVKEDGELNMDEIEEYEGSINLMNPLHIKEFFSKSENKQYGDKYWKAIVAKWEGEQKPSGESKPKPKFKKVTLNIEQIPPSVPLPPVVDASKFKQKTISFNPPPSPKEDSNAKLKQRQQSMKDKLKKINDETPPPPPPPKKITSPNGFGAFETYLLLRIQPDKDNEANNLIKMLERNFIERGFNEKTTKEIKKILKLAKYKDLVIESAIQERINNPVVSVAPVAPSEVPQAKKRGRPKKKKIEPGSNKLVLVDNIIKKNNEVTKMLKEYYDFVFEEGSQ